jgi:hypothetical protein
VPLGEGAHRWLFGDALALGGRLRVRGLRRRRVLRLRLGSRRRSDPALPALSAALSERFSRAARAPGLCETERLEGRGGGGRRERRQLVVGGGGSGARLLRRPAERHAGARHARRCQEAGVHATAGKERRASARGRGSPAVCRVSATPLLSPLLAPSRPRRVGGRVRRAPASRAPLPLHLRRSATLTNSAQGQADGAAECAPGARRGRVRHAADGQRGACAARKRVAALSASCPPCASHDVGACYQARLLCCR